MNDPKYHVGQKVQSRNDRCVWENATVVQVRAEYHYTLAFPPDRHFPGGEVAGVWWPEKNIKASEGSNER